MTPILFASETQYNTFYEAVNDGSTVSTDSADDIILKLTKYTGNDFATQGLGSLTECTSCTVTENRNGTYELELTYPMTGKHYDDIAISCIILAVPAYKKDAEPFRIYKISKPMSGIITVYAEHISYQLSNIPVMPFTASNVSDAMTKLKNNSAETNPFSFWTDKSTVANMAVTVPSSCRSLLGGVSGSVLDTYGGEYEFTGYTVKLHNARGLNRGVTIRYGKNLIDLKQEESIENTVTGICPYWADDDGNVVTLSEKVIHSSYAENFPYQRTIVKDFSGDFDEQPTEAQLRTAGEAYITQSGIGIPTVSINVSFVMLSQFEEYKDMALLEAINLCDTVTVQFEKLGIDVTAKVVKTEYDVLNDRYNSISVGSTSTNLTKTISEIETATDNKIAETKTNLQTAIQTATDLITGNSGGYVVMHKDANGQPYEILIMDTADIDTATKVWRWNSGGLGYSSTGYSGPYATAITSDGKIVADFITTGTLDASQATITNINASNITSGTFEGSKMTIKDLVVGENVTMGSNAKISWSNVTDTSDVIESGDSIQLLDNDAGYQNATQVTTITKDTIATSKISADQITTGTLDAERIGVTLGGRNILRDTKTFGTNGVAATEEGYLTCGSTLTDGYADFKARYLASTSGGGAVMCEYPVFNVANGDTYTASFYAKGTGKLRAYFYGPSGYKPVSYGVASDGSTTTSGDGNINITLTSSWERYWITYTISPTTTNTVTTKYFMLRNDNLPEWWVCGVKLEKGNKATDWSPSPLDIEGTLANGSTTIDGGCITTGTIDASKATITNINASNITTGTLSDTSGNYSLDMSTGTVNMASANITGGSINITTASQTTDSIKLAFEAAFGSGYMKFLSTMSPNYFAQKYTSPSNVEHEVKLSGAGGLVFTSGGSKVTSLDSGGLYCGTSYSDAPGNKTVAHATWVAMAGVTVSKAGYYIVIGSVHEPTTTSHTAETEVGIDISTNTNNDDSGRLAKVSLYHGGNIVFHDDSENQVVWFGYVYAGTNLFTRAWQANSSSASVTFNGAITATRIG